MCNCLDTHARSRFPPFIRIEGFRVGRPNVHDEKPTFRFMFRNLCDRFFEFGRTNTTKHRYRLGVFPVPHGFVRMQLHSLIKRSMIEIRMVSQHLGSVQFAHFVNLSFLFVASTLSALVDIFVC